MPKPKVKRIVTPEPVTGRKVIPDEEKMHYKKLASICMNPDTEVEALKKISCQFYRNGSCPSCIGCVQDDATVQECAQAFAVNIVKRPMPIWAPSFQELRSRPKVAMYDMDNFELNCDNCYISSKCPLHEPNSTCGVDWKSLDTFDKETKGIDWLIDMQKARIIRAQKFEEMDGGIPDDTLSREMDRLASLLKDKADMGVARVKISAEASMPGSGSTTPSGGSIFERIFGAPKLPVADEVKKLEAPVVDIPHTDVTPVKDAVRFARDLKTKT